MTHRAFCEDLTSDRVLISDSEAHHLLHVARLQTGDVLSLFDGRGTEAVAEISSTTRRDVHCTVLSKTTHSRDRRATLTVIASPAKADRLKWMVEKLTEIGVDRLILLNTQRTVVSPGDAKVEKLRANVIAACKQCRRPFLMELLPIRNFDSVVTDIAAQVSHQKTYIAHPAISSVAETMPFAVEQSLQLLIGPEGGFTDTEVSQALDAGAIPVSWPSNILRIETAAVVFSTLLLSQSRAPIVNDRGEMNRI